MEVMVVVGRSGNLMILDCDVLLQNIKLSEYRGLTSSYNFSFFHNSTPRESSLQTANFTETAKSYSPKTHHISQVALLYSEQHPPASVYQDRQVTNQFFW